MRPCWWYFYYKTRNTVSTWIPRQFCRWSLADSVPLTPQQGAACSKVQVASSDRQLSWCRSLRMSTRRHSMVSMHWACLLVSQHAKASWWQMQWTLIILGLPFLSNADMPRFLPTITEAPSEARLKGSGRPGHLWLVLLLCSQWLFVHLVIQCLGSPLRHFNQEADFYFRVSDILNKHNVLFNLNIGHSIHRKATAPCFFEALMIFLLMTLPIVWRISLTDHKDLCRKCSSFSKPIVLINFNMEGNFL